MRTNSQRQEANIAQRLAAIFGKARTQPGSGNQPTAPNDVTVPGKFHVECKETSKASMTVLWAWINGACVKALSCNVHAVLALRFSAYSRHDFFLIEDEEFYRLLEVERDYDALLEKLRERAKGPHAPEH